MDEAARRRFTELLAGLERATEADKAELEMYLADEPELRPELERRLRELKLGQGWLVRVETDQELRRQGSSTLVKVERAVGLGLLGAGLALGPVLGAAAPVAGLAGVGVLLWSFVRLRIREAKDDPYRRIDQ